MNKKTLYSFILSAVVLPVLTLAEDAGGTGPSNWFSKAENLAKSIGASIVVIGWIIAGILWLVAAGNPSKIGIAKSAIFACVVGTILVLIAATACTFISGALGVTGTCG